MGLNTPDANVPAELRRQGNRVAAQRDRLKDILKNSNEYLDEIIKIMTGYSDSVVEEFKKLQTAITAYSGKADKIYTRVSENLINHADKLSTNLEGLQASVQSVADSVANL